MEETTTTEPVIEQPSVFVQVWDSTKYAMGAEGATSDSVTPAAMWIIGLLSFSLGGVLGYTYGYKHAMEGEEPMPVVGMFAGA